MPTKDFERTASFYEVQGANGTVIHLPLLTVTLIQPNGNRVTLPLLFDTGASVTTLRSDLYPLLGVPSWDAGQPQQTTTANGLAQAFRYEGIVLEAFGRSFAAPVQLMQLPVNPLYVGLLGREKVMDQFGFGFWESTKELLVTCSP